MTPTNKPKVGLLITPKDDEPGKIASPEEPDSDDYSSDDNVNNNAGQSCSTCYSFQPSTGRCLMFPPHGSEWSMVEPDDWCCQYKKGQQHEPGQPTGEQDQAAPARPQAPDYAGAAR